MANEKKPTSHDIFAKKIRESVNNLLKYAPKDVKKEGTTVIKENGKTYVYNFNKGKKK